MAGPCDAGVSRYCATTMLLAATRVAEEWSVGNVVGAVFLGVIALAAIFWAILSALR